ncbi:MAG: AAA family ATPase [Candidatus Gracilibacteria bacterium]|nr:AAA family ATPase [Candidatus Gracilibacteria bacterium]
MKIEIKNCNNINNGIICIEKNKLNIKFGINGTGKSTTAKSIQYKIEKEQDLEKLLPFSLKKENSSNLKPEVIFDEELKSVSIFNEEYVKTFLFKQDELVNNSFEVFIKSPTYTEIEKNIETQLETIKKVFSNNQHLDKIILDFENLSKSFKTTQSGLSDASAISKGVGSGFYNIPENLKEYKPFIQNKEKCVSWLDWQIKGSDFINGHDNCPYCVSPTDKAKKEKIKSISDNYDKNVIKNFVEIIKVLENLGDYFSPTAKSQLEKITKKTEGLISEEKDYIVAIKNQIDNFLQRLKNLKSISFYNLKDDANIETKIQDLIIKVDELFDKLKSEKTEEIVKVFNDSLEKTLEKITDLKKEIGKQKSEIKRLITEHERNINQFLKNAGYKYKVLIKGEVNDYKIKLQHIDYDSEISGGEQYLSFGEKNAFALVLFMFEALSKKSDLIILDDPISSFDKNKKYAILQMLFREDNSFKGKTVLMLTHDIEPIIDSVKVLSKKFKNETIAHFIESKNGILSEKSIKKDDIITFGQICDKIIKDEKINIISKLIYLRRKFEILDDKGDEYQILSDLFHKRTKEEANKDRTEREKGLTDENFEKSFKNGEEELNKIIDNFNYEQLLKIVLDKSELVKIYNELESGYEKLQIFRIINGEFVKNDNFSDVMKKFINETYHIENDFIHQLNPREYNLIPEFIVKECDDYINNLIITKNE